MTDHDEREALIAELRWLADRRDEYSDERVRFQTDSVRLVADILEGKNDGMGWLPSWRWDEWAERFAALEASRPTPASEDEREARLDALFEIAAKYDIPLTNNEPRVQDGQQLYEAGTFAHDMIAWAEGFRRPSPATVEVTALLREADDYGDHAYEYRIISGLAQALRAALAFQTPAEGSVFTGAGHNDSSGTAPLPVLTTEAEQ